MGDSSYLINNVKTLKDLKAHNFLTQNCDLMKVIRDISNLQEEVLCLRTI